MEDITNQPRVALFSLECLGPVFSGNGQYSRCIARGLGRAGCAVLVISGRPAATPLAASIDDGVRELSVAPHSIIDAPLSRWGTLDRGCAWDEFTEFCDRDDVSSAVAAFLPTAVLCVDFHTVRAWTAVAARLRAAGASIPKMTWLNFRVYSASTGFSASDTVFYEREEAAALGAAALSIALCRADALALTALALGRSAGRGGARVQHARDAFLAARGPADRSLVPKLAIVLPPLRSDVEALVRGAEAGAPLPPPPPGVLPGSLLITSLGRLSPEKNAAAVPPFLRAVAAAMTAKQAQCLLLGAPGADAEYAAGVKMGVVVSDAPPPIVPPRLFGPAELSGALAIAAINLHPSLTEAYGMTIVEAASWGVPSLVHVPSSCSGKTDVASFDALAAGAFRVRVDDSAAALLNEEHADALASRLLFSAAMMPPVGACDLLAPTPLDPSSEPGILVWDWEAPLDGARSSLAADFIAQAFGNKRGAREDSGDVIAATSRAARQRALAWSEASHGIALRTIISGESA
jgi:hypothetical protein